MPACGYINSNGTQAPWSRPRRLSVLHSIPAACRSSETSRRDYRRAGGGISQFIERARKSTEVVDRLVASTAFTVGTASPNEPRSPG